LVSNDSLDKHISNMVKRYSSLFTLPSHKKIVILLCAICVLGGLLTIFLLSPNYLGLTLGLIFGLAFFFIVSLSDLIIYLSFMRKAPVFNLRRCSALSLFSCLTWFAIIFLGSLISVFLENPIIWVKLFLLGFSFVLILRLLVFSTTSFAGREVVFLSSIFQPVLCTIPLFSMSSVIGSIGADFFVFSAIFILIAVLAVSLFTFLVNRVGRKVVGIASLPLFKAFMANWTENLNAPLEGFLEKLGYEQDVKLSLLAFRAGGKTKAVMVVPAFHSGPFRNVGSSLLPYMIQNALENEIQCVVSVPHGLAGHGLDLSSQLQSEKVVEKILGSVDFSRSHSKATPLIRSQNKGASASCQVFGDCAFLTLTLSPKTTEDLPQELDVIIVNEAEKRGLSSAIVVDAHNSINGPFNLSEVLEPLKKAALSSLKQALSCERASFEVGAAKIVPEEYGVKEGMGLGGISVITTRVGNRTTAYVIIDGNNIISGLREKILSSLQEIGIVDGEVLTTDTHSVNGVVLTERGYHPIGEAMDNAKLISYIQQAAKNALSNLEPAEVSWHMETVPNIKVIGEKQIEALGLIAEKTAKQAKKLAVSLFSAIGVLLIALLIAF
jgi:putative membrane protein